MRIQKKMFNLNFNRKIGLSALKKYFALTRAGLTPIGYSTADKNTSESREEETLRTIYIVQPPEFDADSIIETDKALWSHVLKHAESMHIGYLSECFNIPRSTTDALSSIGQSGVVKLSGICLCSFQAAVPDDVLVAALERGEIPDVSYGKRVSRSDVDEFARIYWTAAAFQARTNQNHACGIFGFSMEIAQILSRLTFHELERFIQTFPHVWLIRYPVEFLEILPGMLRNGHDDSDALRDAELILLKTFYAAQTAHRERKTVSKLLSDIESRDTFARPRLVHIAAGLSPESSEHLAQHDRTIPDAQYRVLVEDVLPNMNEKDREKLFNLYLADMSFDAYARHGMTTDQVQIFSGSPANVLQTVHAVSKEMYPELVVDAKRHKKMHCADRVAIVNLARLEELLFSALYLVHSGGRAWMDVDMHASTIAHHTMQSLHRFVQWPKILTKTEGIDIAIAWMRGAYKEPSTCPKCGCVTYRKMEPTVEGDVCSWAFADCPVCAILETKRLFHPVGRYKEDAYSAVQASKRMSQKKKRKNTAKVSFKPSPRSEKKAEKLDE